MYAANEVPLIQNVMAYEGTTLTGDWNYTEDVPTQIFDWWNYGGITRDVRLVKVTPVYLEDYSLQ